MPTSRIYPQNRLQSALILAVLLIGSNQSSSPAGAPNSAPRKSAKHTVDLKKDKPSNEPTKPAVLADDEKAKEILSKISLLQNKALIIRRDTLGYNEERQAAQLDYQDKLASLTEQALALGPKSYPVFIESLKSSNPQVQTVSDEALMKAGDGALPLILQQLKVPQHAPQVDVLVLKLGKNIMPLLLEMLHSSVASERQIAVTKLALLQPPCDGKLRFTGRRPYVWNAKTVTMPLSTSAVKEVCLIAGSEKDANVCADFANLLGVIGPRSPLVEQTLIAYSKNDQPLVRQSAIGAIGRIMFCQNQEDRATGTAVLVDRLNNDEFQDCRAYAAEDLGDRGLVPDSVIDALIKGTKDGYPCVRASAFASLSTYGSKASPVVPALVERLKSDPSGAGGKEAMMYLSLLRETAAPAVPVLASLLSSADREISRNALETLGALRGASSPAVPDIVKCLKSSDLVTRSTAEMTLIKMGPSAIGAESAVREILSGDDDTRRRAGLLNVLRAITGKNEAELNIAKPIRTPDVRGLPTPTSPAIQPQQI